MTTVDIDGYVADKHLEKLAGMDSVEQNRLRKERNQKKKERAVITGKIELLQDELCTRCKNNKIRNSESNKCGCPAAQEIRKLGKKLGWTTPTVGRPKERIDEPGKYDHVTADIITWDIFMQMKSDRLSDRDIMRQLGWSSNRFYKWKKELEESK